jgi:deoxyribodipyrimidine photolyase-related protein
VEKGKPVGGQWNFDKENRQAFDGPPSIPRPYRARPDRITREVIDLVARKMPHAPGRIDHFRWPVTAAQAKRSLDDFIDNRLTGFGTYEDAMWAGEAVLYHSRLSTPLNLKLIKPCECIDAAVEAHRRGSAQINAVEGFVRQIIGWREFIRGVYYREGPEYTQRNALDQNGRLPAFFWTGETDMLCLRHCIGEVLENAWGHHIPRLMVIGNFALTAGVHPHEVHAWFLGMYADGVDWVTAPNVIGMSQHADGGVVGTKPYAASGKYIQRMSNYCESCRFDPQKRTGADACPFNVFYWDFLLRHRRRFEKNQRMAMVLRNAVRIAPGERRMIRRHAEHLRREHGI